MKVLRLFYWCLISTENIFVALLGGIFVDVDLVQLKSTVCKDIGEHKKIN